jgi:pimeloyl-ACP methyl ester carboxylesterase
VKRRRAGILGALLGLAATGVAAGVAAERYVLRNSRRGDDPYTAEPFGELPFDKRFSIKAPDGVDVYVELVDGSAGAPDDLTVVFVHGFCLDMGTFHFQRRHFAGRYRSVFYDQPGHGRSGRLPRGEYTLEVLGATLRAVINATAPTGRVVLVGHSMGGMTIMAMAEQTPEFFAERVAGVALISTSAGRGEQVRMALPDLVARFREPLGPVIRNAGRLTTSVADRARRASTDLAWLLTRRYGFASAYPSRSVVSYVERMNSTTSTEVIARYLRTLYTHARVLALAALRDVPVLLVCGDRDYLTPVAQTRAIARILPDARLVVVPQAGHVALLEHPDAVNTVIGEFLADLA